MWENKGGLFERAYCTVLAYCPLPSLPSTQPRPSSPVTCVLPFPPSCPRVVVLLSVTDAPFPPASRFATGGKVHVFSFSVLVSVLFRDRFHCKVVDGSYLCFRESFVHTD